MGRRLLGVLLAILAAGAPPAASASGAAVEAFERMKGLAGHWVGREPDGSPALASYDVISGGSALRERLTMGSTATMVSIYHPVGDRLMLTHYCLNRTQARMRTATVTPGAARFDFGYLDATNVLRATDGLMRDLTVELEGPDAFVQRWHAANTTEPAVVVRFERARGRGDRRGMAHRYPPVAQDQPPAFRRLAALAGTWDGTIEGGTAPRPPRARYEVVAGGNAVMETLDFGGGTPMVTMYYPDGDQLMLTHYCGARNQPRMRTASIPPGAAFLVFPYKDATNVLAGTVSFMRHLRVDFEGPDRFVQTWNQDSDQQGGSFRFSFTRRPARGGAR